MYIVREELKVDQIITENLDALKGLHPMKIKSIVISSLVFVLSYFVCSVIQKVNAESEQILIRLLIALIVACGVMGYYGYKSLAEKIEDIKKYVQ